MGYECLRGVDENNLDAEGHPKPIEKRLRPGKGCAKLPGKEEDPASLIEQFMQYLAENENKWKSVEVWNECLKQSGGKVQQALAKLEIFTDDLWKARASLRKGYSEPNFMGDIQKEKIVAA